MNMYNCISFFTEQCDNVNKLSVGLPSAPLHIANKQEWYKYIDDKTGQIKLALNFSWMPALDCKFLRFNDITQGCATFITGEPNVNNSAKQLATRCRHKKCFICYS